MKLLLVVNVDWFFLSHRKEIAQAAHRQGWDVTVVTADTGRLKDIGKIGLKAVNLPMSRSGMNIVKELKTLWFLARLYKREQPDVVHHVGMKVILWGTLAAKYAKVRGVVNAVNGRGSFFADENKTVLSQIMPKVLRLSHSMENLLVIFQNNEDRSYYLKNGIIKEPQARLIKGSGIDLNVFSYAPEPIGGKTIVILTERMIVEKGIFILTEAAEMLREEYGQQVEFWLVGGLDDHPGAITRQQLEDVCDGRYIKWIGFSQDVKGLLRRSHVVACPSFYMEGLPKSLIEAAATGRPIVTSNSIGCKDTVDDGVNGYLVPPRDAASLAKKLKYLFDHPDVRKAMGRASRVKAEKEFSIDKVVEKHLQIYNELISNQ